MNFLNAQHTYGVPNLLLTHSLEKIERIIVAAGTEIPRRVSQHGKSCEGALEEKRYQKIYLFATNVCLQRVNYEL